MLTPITTVEVLNNETSRRTIFMTGNVVSVIESIVEKPSELANVTKKVRTVAVELANGAMSKCDLSYEDAIDLLSGRVQASGRKYAKPEEKKESEGNA